MTRIRKSDLRAWFADLANKEKRKENRKSNQKSKRNFKNVKEN